MSGLTRGRAMLLLLTALGILVGFDVWASRPLDPFAAPPPLALWSGQSGATAHCALPPR